MDRVLIDRLAAARKEHRPVVVATDLASGEKTWIEGGSAAGPVRVDDAVLAAADTAQRDDRSRTIETGDGRRLFLHVFNPPLRLLIVGAVHIAQSLAPIAALAGYAVTVIDPRGSFATSDRFPGVVLTGDWPDEALAALRPDARTAIVTLTHDPKLDDPALHSALRSDCFYIGSLGSRRTHASRVERLNRAGFGSDEIARIHGPIGLDIGASSPAEIALAIMGEITVALRRPQAKAA
ncbi:MAG: xanthine dehydrogenase [Rhodospirillaceae bacterium]|nr:xanthine dehydrogenase [Rhodospirillaceae bacterium]MYB12515.1 xanthine dehydrogenase [Rhodospirillaceae bacterium]MYI49702.1 xanthine dehydrogenase [Rhodospirillaceae bacterium]